jgi:peptide deformylase
MAFRPIRLLGDPVLRERSAEVATFDKELRTLVRDLTETMLDAPGAGLSAPQIGVSLRVLTYDVDEEIGHLCNPQIEVVTEEMMDGGEGCLSIPGLSFARQRPKDIVATGLDMHGEPTVISCSNLLSRCIQHETDHLDGVLFVDQLDPETMRIAKKAIREAEWFGELAPVVKQSPHPLFSRVS